MKKKSAETLTKWRNEMRNLKFELGLINAAISENPETLTIHAHVSKDKIMIRDKVITCKLLITLQAVVTESIKAYEETISFYENLANPRDKNGYDKNNRHPDFD